jgi:hypothetical protein
VSVRSFSRFVTLAASGPAVVEVLVERDYPLSGSPAVGWWDVPLPVYSEERRERYEREGAEEW